MLIYANSALKDLGDRSVHASMFIVVYHDPGGDDSALLSLASRLEVRVMRVSEVPGPISKGDLVILLMPLRGGHADSIRKACEAVGATWLGTIPPGLTATIIARKARSLGCDSVRPYYWKARRLEGEQLEDLKAVAKELEDLGLRTVLEGCADCVAPMALLEGRVAREARAEAARCGAKALGPLMSEGADLIEGWLRGLVEKRQGFS